MTPYYDDHGVTIYHGDVFEVVDTAGSFDAILTDPPYSSGGIFRSDRTALKPTEKYSRAASVAYRHFGGDNRDQRSYLAWLTLWIALAGRGITPGGSICVFSDWRQLAVTTDAVQAGGFVFRGIGTWHKRGGKPTKGCFRAGSEFVVHGTWGRTEAECYPDSVLSTSLMRDKQHVAQKPVEVMDWLCTFCPRGGTVLDPFMGSGSTLVAARRRGLRAIGGDIDEHWCELAAKRLSEELPLVVAQ